MKIQGQYSFPFAQAVVWQALRDPEILARTLPGCDRLEREGEDRFKGTLRIQVGPVQGQFAGTVELSNLQPEDSFNISVRGEGPAGFMSGAGIVRLATVANDTVMTYDLDAQIGGRIAGVGQRLLDSSARAITRQALEGLKRQLEARQNAGDSPGSQPDAPSATAFAAGVAREVVKDFAGRLKNKLGPKDPGT